MSTLKLASTSVESDDGHGNTIVAELWVSKRLGRRRCHGLTNKHKTRFVTAMVLHTHRNLEYSNDACADSSLIFESSAANKQIEKFNAYDQSNRISMDYIFEEPLEERTMTGSASTIKALHINYVDGGVKNLREFVDSLAYTFPKLEFLMWKQNYSPDKHLLAFLEHPFISKLKELFIEDRQSGWTIEPQMLSSRLIQTPNGFRHIGTDCKENDVSDARFVLQMSRSSMH